MYQHLLASWRACVRSHSFRSISILALLLLIFAYMASNFSGRSPQTITLDVGISGIRITVLLMAVFWVQELLGREIDRRTVYFSLAYPVERMSYLLGRYFGVVAMAGLAVFFMGLSLLLLVTLAGNGYHQAFQVDMQLTYFGNMLLIWLDIACVLAFVFLLSSLATSALLPMMLGITFAVIARSYGSVLALLADKQGEAADIAPVFMPLVNMIAWLIPDLGRLDVRASVLYRAPINYPDLAVNIVVVVAYSAFSLGLAALLFSRREFN
ncbi:hypothetical protein R0381_001150 [Jeongeupia wiesaeckerbachi]|uniref:hypothetical protein n=1 Tax=Jeongeupia wiesaeckerbachi TaxID=3051218 RepID=UPI003D800F20